ncbi:cytochrome c [Brevundimonas sp. 2R-24]|uniref:Cytochrome c n=1 Tax=Peiella sedimenti TaxID=3061083 RepID=A0ABT8SMT6_9CAUL|nr:cytochrome c [Caulobacteraceae bacterium XZ-24]
MLLLMMLLSLMEVQPRPGVAGPPVDMTVSALHGETLVRERCGACHAVGREGPSPLADAPPLREIPNRYPVDNLEEALAEGIIVAHDGPMPAFEMEPEDITDIIAYLRTLKD